MTVGVETRQRNAIAKSVGSPSVRPKRRVSLLIGGLLLVVVCAGIFALLQLRGDARTQVLAIARPVAAGQPITSQDLRVVRVMPDASVELIPAHEATQVLGRSAAVPLAEGSLLAESQLGPTVWPPSGQAVTSVALKPGRLPIGTTAGSHVVLVPVAKEIPAEPSSASTSQPAVPATVVGVVEGVDGSGTSVVSLLLTQPDAVKVTGSAAEFALVLVAG
jgi:hypothetical protein